MSCYHAYLTPTLHNFSKRITIFNKLMNFKYIYVSLIEKIDLKLQINNSINLHQNAKQFEIIKQRSK